MNLEMVDEKDIPITDRAEAERWTKWGELRRALRQMPNDDPTKWIKVVESGLPPKNLASRIRMALAVGSESFRLKIIKSDGCVYVRKSIPGVDYPKTSTEYK